MRTILTFFIGSAIFAAFALAGCGGTDAPAGRSIVATTAQVADLTRNVVGDRGEVTEILAANADPHEYEPRPSDAEALAGADLVVRSGGEVDDWLDPLIASSGSDAPVLTLSEHVSELEGDDGADPHWWQDPRNAIRAVAAIGAELDRLDRADSPAFDANVRRYSAALERLDRRIAACMERIPPARRKLVTSHDALAYYANRYGIEVIGAAIPALTTQAQASAGDTAELVDLIRSAGVTTIFPEAGVSTGLEDAIADEAGARIGGELWADTLGAEGTAAGTYIGSLEANTAELAAGFSDGAVSCRFR